MEFSVPNTIFSLMSSDKSDIAFIEGYLYGDRDSVRYVNECIRLAFLSWRNRFGYQTDDILSDARFELFMSLDCGKFAQKSSLKTYITRIVQTTCIDYYRTQIRRKTEDIDENPQLDNRPSAEEMLERREKAFLNFRALRMLPKVCLKLLHLHIKEGLSWCEIGERLNASDVSIRARMYKCRKMAVQTRKKLQEKEKRF